MIGRKERRYTDRTVTFPYYPYNPYYRYNPYYPYNPYPPYHSTKRQQNKAQGDCGARQF